MTTPAELYEPFRPRAARVVSAGLAVLTVLGAVAIILATPRLDNVTFTALDQAGTILVALLICWFCWRQYSVSAVPDREGVTVRNLVFQRRVTWEEIVSVRFGQGRPWAQLDLADGDTLAVMGIQSADGERGKQEARRLATLLALHEPRED